MAMFSKLDSVPSEPRLYIGGLFTLKRKDLIQKANITHVLSVLRLPLDKELFASYKHYVVEVDDVEDENLIQSFPATNAFIDEGLAGDGSVFVHCAMGKSRSATCVIAWMIHKFDISPTQALQQLRQSRPLVEPNEGFMQQLEMYHQMQATTDIENSPIYQRWLYQRAVQESSACGQAPEVENIRFEDEHADQNEIADSEFRCRKCRRTLATSAYLIPHVQPPHNKPFPTTLTCAHHYLDPLSWMRPELEQGKIEGRLECPKCSSNVGKYAWQGLRCSCGAWVVPAITLTKSKVDEAKMRPRNSGLAGAAGEGPNAIRRGPGVGMPVSRAQGRGML